MASKQSSKPISLTNHTGDIFAAPENTVLIHACNTQGSWGGGIAVPFKNIYPKAFETYHRHCISNKSPVKTGTCLLIEPDETGTSSRHWIACLFTSKRYGRGKDRPDEILENSGRAVRDLLEQLKEAEEEGRLLGGLRMCRINSGRFGVEWGRTEEVLEDIKVEERWRGDIEVWGREEDLL
ncbi:hypothetical protein HYALB_00006942 [Hymenoscyphus albidus]|uniref:ADP-ribose 1''-phosphate phosphatase n=1 Tax=Hymenoscyphus albidus TaxID=595503 RepID=A0A9N9LEY0_9HELO|nr:hypothetical protein HYALB_00006942 [Hymenoscyphus albidus]